MFKGRMNNEPLAVPKMIFQVVYKQDEQYVERITILQIQLGWQKSNKSKENSKVSRTTFKISKQPDN